MWAAALRPIVERLEAEGDAAWPQIVEQHDEYSVREFLEASRWSEGAIELFGIVYNYRRRGSGLERAHEIGERHLRGGRRRWDGWIGSSRPQRRPRIRPATWRPSAS
jgi:hypothetical protein